MGTARLVNYRAKLTIISTTREYALRAVLLPRVPGEVGRG